MVTSNPVPRKKSRFRLVLAGILLLSLLIFLFSTQILTTLGSLLVQSDRPHPTSAIIVLAGGSGGDRILKACELVREGYAPKAWVSGPETFYGQNESKFAIEFAVSRGCDPSWFEAFPNQCLSTRDEAILFRDVLRERGAGDYTVVTSSFHTRRARNIFMKEIPELSITMIGSQAEYFTADSWWKTREGRKLFAYEILKSLTSPFGI